MPSLKDEMRKLGVSNGTVLIGPESVEINVTQVCNLKCIYCFYHSPLARNECKEEHMPLETFKTIIDDLKALGTESVMITGGGEPTAHPQFANMIDFLKSRNMRITVFTNGVFDKSVIKHMMKVDGIEFNLASLRDDRYRRIQSSTSDVSVKTPLDNIRVISMLRARKHMSNPIMTLVFIINEINWDETENVFRFAEKRGALVKFKFMSAFPETQNLIISEYSAERLKRDMEMIAANDSGITNASRMLMQLDRLKPVHDRETIRTWGDGQRVFYFNVSNRPVSKCYMGWFLSSINTNGDVRYCACDQHVLGNVNKKSFADIWKSEDYMNLRLRYRDAMDINDPRWAVCKYCNRITTNSFRGDYC